jgi:hypothetical protein
VIASVAADVSHLKNSNGYRYEEPSHQGYDYPKPHQGYDYPKPAIPFELPNETPAPTYLPPQTRKSDSLLEIT